MFGLGWGFGEVHVGWWIVFCEEGVGGVFVDLGEELVSLSKECGEIFDSEGVAAVFAVGDPLLHLLWVESGLGACDCYAGEAGGFS